MRVMLRHWHFVDKTGAQPLNRTPRCQIIGIAGNYYRVINRTDEKRHRPARFQRITVAPKFRANFKTNMPRANPNMFGIANAEIDMASVCPVTEQYAKMIRWNKIARWITRHNANKTQSHSPEV